MTRDEKRACRREYINYWLHKNFLDFSKTLKLSDIIYFVRCAEMEYFSESLNIYSTEG